MAAGVMAVIADGDRQAKQIRHVVMADDAKERQAAVVVAVAVAVALVVAVVLTVAVAVAVAVALVVA